MHPTDHAALDPIIAALFSREYQDPLTPTDLANVLGVNRRTVQVAMHSGAISHRAEPMRPRDLMPLERRRANKGRAYITKADAALWLWKTRKGDRDMLRAALAHHAPAVLRVLESLEATDAATTATPCPEAAKKIIPHPAMRARQLRQLPPASDAQTLFAFAS